MYSENRSVLSTACVNHVVEKVVSSNAKILKQIPGMRFQVGDCVGCCWPHVSPEGKYFCAVLVQE